MIKELSPISVFITDEPKADHRVSCWSDGFSDQGHVSLSRCSPTLMCIASHAIARHVLPSASTTLASGSDVVNAQFTGLKVAAAVLVLIPIPGEDVSAVEFDLLLRKLVIAQETNHFWYSDVHADGTDPLIVFSLNFLEPISNLRDVCPDLEVVCSVGAIIDSNHLS